MIMSPLTVCQLSRGCSSRQSAVHYLHQTGAEPLLHRLHWGGAGGVAGGGPGPRPLIPNIGGVFGGQLCEWLGGGPRGRGQCGGRHQLRQVLRGQAQPGRHEPKPRHHLHVHDPIQVSQRETSFCYRKDICRLIINFDGTEVDSPPTPSAEYSKGFSIYYSQISCWGHNWHLVINTLGKWCSKYLRGKQNVWDDILLNGNH